jgi:hypothetical protein
MKGVFSLVFVSTSLLLAACTPGQFFADLATSAVEKAASEKIEVNEDRQLIVDLMEAKKSAFPESVTLIVQHDEDDFVGMAYRNDYDVDKKYLLDIESILPIPVEGGYHAWILNPESKEMKYLGELTKEDLGDYVFMFESSDDLRSFSHVVISLETTVGESLTQPILAGQFGLGES